MQVKHHFKSISAGFLLMATGGLAQAQDAIFVPAMPAQSYVQNAGSFMLAANETNVVIKSEAATTSAAPKQEYEPPLLSGSNTHLALGLAAIVAAGLTGATAPGESCENGCSTPPPPRDVNGAHAKLAYATVALAAATVTSGVIFHWDDFHFEDGITDPDNLHALVGIAGATMMAVATANSAKVKTGTANHAGLAMAGAAGMIAAIKITW